MEGESHPSRSAPEAAELRERLRRLEELRSLLPFRVPYPLLWTLMPLRNATPAQFDQRIEQYRFMAETFGESKS